jgi:lysyl endopeptidase
MSTSDIRRTAVTVLSVLLAGFGHAASAAVAVHIVKTDLRPLIHAAVDSPVQFAVLVPHAASAANAGNWSVEGAQATWRYAVAVPTAVSLSFHATRSSLPESATLIVRGAKTTTSYRAHDLHRGELWSRIQPGEALEFALTVAAADRSGVDFRIVSLQAGYRALGPGVQDHPYYRQLKAQAAAASGNASCVTNYECKVNASNTPAGAATVALIIGNLYQCSGSLINDVPGDNTPYILTARHCETGQLGGGSPGAASTVAVYWDATSPCGSTLGSIYDGATPTQTGAQTVVEQQDAWLIRLDVNPVVPDAQLAGFDASGGAVQGGYTIHHGEGNDKQFAGWSGTAAAVLENNVLGVSYLSNFWETVNQVGNIGPGASGSGLFDQNNHLVGSLSLGRQTTDPSGYGSCPLASPPNPNGTNGVADFTSLAAVWSSTADTTSSTGSTTVKSVLDPANTGTMVVPSLSAAVIQFNPFTTDQFAVGDAVQMAWNAANATQCTASGGIAGDGWSGTLAAVGTLLVRETAPATVTYVLSCAFSGGRTARASITLIWVTTPLLQFEAPFEIWTTRPAVLSWSSNVTPCSISGGSLSLTNLPASGTTTTTAAAAGDVTYTLSCGPANNNETLARLVHYVTPSLIFEANGTDRLLGQTFFLQWLTFADSCTPSGGAPNDGWATTAFNQNFQPVQFAPHVTATGTYTYTLTCSSGPISLQQSVTVTFENNAPFVTTSLSAPSVTFSASPADYVTFTWNSNLSNCSVSFTPSLPVLNDGNYPFDSTPLPQGMVTIAPYQSGTYTLSTTCTVPALNSTSVTSTPIALTVLPAPAPTASISFNPGSVVAGENFTTSWSSTDALICSETGGIPGGTWGEVPGFSEPPVGSVTEVGQSGQFTFGLTCQSIDPKQGAVSTQSSLTIVALDETLTASATSVTNGNPFTLTWSSTGATSCTAHGGGANGTPWSGSLSTLGTLTQTSTTNGTFTYELDCGAGNQMISKQLAITVSAASGSGSGGGSGGSGGGAIGVLELALLAALRGMRFSAPGRVGRRSHGPWRR